SELGRCDAKPNATPDPNRPRHQERPLSLPPARQGNRGVNGKMGTGVSTPDDGADRARGDCERRRILVDSEKSAIDCPPPGSAIMLGWIWGRKEEETDYQRWFPRLRAFAKKCRRAIPVPPVSSFSAAEREQYRILYAKMQEIATSRD